MMATELSDEVYKIRFVSDHRSTMPRKHPRDMTNEEAIRHLFHPKVVKHVQGIINEINSKPVKSPKDKKK